MQKFLYVYYYNVNDLRSYIMLLEQQRMKGLNLSERDLHSDLYVIFFPYKGTRNLGIRFRNQRGHLKVTFDKSEKTI